MVGLSEIGRTGEDPDDSESRTFSGRGRRARLARQYPGVCQAGPARAARSGSPTRRLAPEGGLP